MTCQNVTCGICFTRGSFSPPGPPYKSWVVFCSHEQPAESASPIQFQTVVRYSDACCLTALSQDVQPSLSRLPGLASPHCDDYSHRCRGGTEPHECQYDSAGPCGVVPCNATTCAGSFCARLPKPITCTREGGCHGMCADPITCTGRCCGKVDPTIICQTEPSWHGCGSYYPSCSHRCCGKVAHPQLATGSRLTAYSWGTDAQGGLPLKSATMSN